ncbi:DUF6286 domain-containing protein [Streptomyces sp. NPDC099050]|uniref:DUF6286 domain-containing protein n=1 Tax=Streptomyces sp. NPDC099050 TaxID=3366100 RepID=UPI003823124B
MTDRERGTTTVADRVVRKIAEQAAREVVAGDGGRVTKGTASVDGRTAEASVTIALAYRGSAGRAARTVQEHVKTRTAHLTGLHLPPPRVRIRELATTPATPPLACDETDHAPERVRTRRWSERRLPVALLAAAVFAAGAAVLRDVTAAHLLGHEPAPWRRALIDRLSGHGSGVPTAWAAAAVVAVAGAWMVVLALTPGRRGDLVMSTPGHGVRAVISRRSAGEHVRAALTQVPGVCAARVRVGRRRLKVRAELAYGEKDQAREHLTRAAAAALGELSLAAPVRTRVRVRPSPRWQPGPSPQQGEEDADGPHA